MRDIPRLRTLIKELARYRLSGLEPKGFQELTYVSEFFDTVEINVTFYRPIPARTSESWVKKVEKNKLFKFTGKLWQGFTHDRNAGAEDERMFKDGYAPLLEAGRLGAIVMQFPWSFRNTSENRQYVAGSSSDFRITLSCSRCVMPPGTKSACSTGCRRWTLGSVTSISRYSINR